MKKTLLLPAAPVLMRALPPLNVSPEETGSTHPHPLARAASAFRPLTDVLLTLWTVESSAAVRYDLRLDGFLLMVTRTAAFDAQVFCAQRDVAAFQSFVDAALRTLRLLSRERSRVTRGMPMRSPDDASSGVPYLREGVLQRWAAVLDGVSYGSCVKLPTESDCWYSDIPAQELPRLFSSVALSLSTSQGRQEAMYVAGLAYLTEIISAVYQLSETVHSEAGSGFNEATGSASYLRMMSYVHWGKLSRIVTAQDTMRGLLRATWPELTGVPAPERYLKGGVPLAAKIAGRYTHGMSRSMRAAFNEACTDESHRRLLSGVVRQALTLSPAAEVEALLRQGGLRSPLTPLIRRRIPSQGLHVEDLADLRAVTLDLARHEALGDLTEDQLPERFWLIPAFNGGIEQRLISLRDELRYNRSRFQEMLDDAYAARCAQLGISRHPLKGQPFALSPDAWNQDLTVTHEEQTATFLFRTCASDQDLIRESDEMIHCVGRGSYTAAAASGLKPIVSVRVAGDLKLDLAFTVEITADGQVRQSRGKRNADLGELQRAALQTWLREAVRAPDARPSAPEPEWQSVRAQLMRSDVDLRRTAQLQAEARVWASESAREALEDEARAGGYPSAVAARDERERLLRRRLLAFVAEIDRAAEQALRGAQQLLKTTCGLSAAGLELPGPDMLSEDRFWQAESVTLFDSPYGPVLTVFCRTLSPKISSGRVGWRRTSQVTRFVAGSARHCSRGNGPSAAHRRVSYYTAAFEDALSSVPSWAEPMLVTMFGVHAAGDLSGLLRPARLPRRAADRQALMDAWAEKKAQLGVQVSERCILMVRGTELTLSSQRTAHNLRDQDVHAELLNGNLDQLLRGEGLGFQVIASQRPTPRELAGPALQVLPEMVLLQAQ